MHSLLPAVALPAVILLSAVTIIGCGALMQTAARTGPRGGPGTGYYLSLGDSLAQGVQPDPAGVSLATRHGYADQLYAVLRRRDPGLRLVKLGCPGETTATMISGRHCSYPAGSQLAAAAGFLRAHPGHVSLITFDIGANDPNSCFSWPMPDTATPCAGGPDPSTAANLAKIMARLRAVAGSRVTIIAMSYGREGRKLARLSERRVLAFDAMLARVYAVLGVRIADVSGAFRSTDFARLLTVRGLGRLPRSVAAVCQWAWACTGPPRGPDEHPNTPGYAVIARAFLAADQPGAAAQRAPPVVPSGSVSAR